jgi:lipopolysaccharide transport system permease protein
VKREFLTKFQNSLLGIFWVLLNPLAMILVYTVVFSHLMKAKLPNFNAPFAYSIYLCVGILSWGLFADTSSRALNLFLENANLLKKIKFPKVCLPIILLINSWINFAIIFGLFTLFLILTGNFPGVVFIAIFPILLIMSLLGLGLGLGLGVLNIFYRDIGQLYGIGLQFWFWLTPIVYTMDILPDPIQTLFKLNPIVPLISNLQKIMLTHQWPSWSSLTYPFILSVVICIWAIRLFKRHQDDMMDEL